MRTDQRIWTHWGFTLIDITETGVTQWNGKFEKERNQQRNWETIQQILNLKTQVLRISQLVIDQQDLSMLEFGDYYLKDLGFKYKLWAFEFDVEYIDAYATENDPYGILYKDFEKVPVIMGLEETINLPVPLFYPHGQYKNIHFIPRP